MILLSFLARWREIMSQLLQPPYVLGTVENNYLVGIMDVILDIIYVVIEHTVVLLAH